MNNKEIISQYYEAHRHELLNFVNSRVREAGSAEDIVQEVFLRLLSGCRPLSPVTLPSLVYTVARNLIADYYRRHRQWTQFEHVVRNEGCVTTDSPESIFSAEQIKERMEQRLALLPESCREVYRLHIYDGMRVSEISQTLGQGYKQVEHRLGQARREIRNYLKHVS